MENIVVGRQREESSEFGARRLPIMRTLARFHGCDVGTLFSWVDASEPEVHDVLREMVSRNEVEASRQPSEGRHDETFALTSKGWGEYMKALGSIYELPE